MPVARRTPTPSEIYSRLDRSRLQAKGWPLFPVRTRIPVVFSARPLDDLIVALSSVRQEFSSESWLRSASQDEFIGLAKRPRSTPFAIPERSASIRKLNTSTVTSSYELTTGRNRSSNARRRARGPLGTGRDARASDKNRRTAQNP